MYEINELRDKIDKVDKEIINLIEKRMDIVGDVALYKIKNNIPILDEEREKDVINKNINRIKNENYISYAKDIFIKIMEESKKYQKNFMENKNLYGLIGEKLGHSKSPQLHKKIFNDLGIEGEYKLLETKKDNLKEFIEFLIKAKFKGVNVTIPYKVEIMKYIQKISKEAQDIGAVNTIKFKDGKAIGYNTDYYGFEKTLEVNKVNVKDENIVILGSGGAALMVYKYLLNNKASNIVLVTRNKENKRVISEFEGCKIINYEELNNISSKYMIVNATPCGMYPNVNESPVHKKILEKFKVAVDLIYNPKETLFLSYGREKGLKTINGLYMLVAQGVLAEAIWNDIKIDDKVIDEIYNN